MLFGGRPDGCIEECYNKLCLWSVEGTNSNLETIGEGSVFAVSDEGVMNVFFILDLALTERNVVHVVLLWQHAAKAAYFQMGKEAGKEANGSAILKVFFVHTVSEYKPLEEFRSSTAATFAGQEPAMH